MDIEAFIRSLPGGFDADWTTDFTGSDGERYVTDGCNWGAIENISDEVAREKARSYWTEVQVCITASVDLERAAIQKLREGNLRAARNYLRAAAMCEADCGDDGTYRWFVKQLESELGE